MNVQELRCIVAELKIRRDVFNLTSGHDIFMDNGACWQLITQRTGRWPHKTCPVLTQKAIKEVNTRCLLKRIFKHGYGDGVTLWRYMGVKQ